MEYHFCPVCGGKLNLSLKSGGKKPRPSCTRCDFVHYGNPKPCVGAVIVRHGKVLLVQRVNEPYEHHWDFPGGFLESGEHPKEGLKRELAEELKVDIKIGPALGIYPDTYGPGGAATLNIYYLCKILTGDISPNQTEVAAARWFSPDTLPSKLAFEHVKLVTNKWKNWRNRKSVVIVGDF